MNPIKFKPDELIKIKLLGEPLKYFKHWSNNPDENKFIVVQKIESLKERRE